MTPRLGYDEVLHPEWFELHAGLDESGKGDFFGPVVAATVIADKSAIEAWIKAGVRDSKKIVESQIIKLDKLIRETHGVAVATCLCGMPKYNLLMSRPRANLNRLRSHRKRHIVSDGARTDAVSLIMRCESNAMRRLIPRR